MNKKISVERNESVILTEEERFKIYLQEISDPKNNSEVNYFLPKKPTPLQISKYKLCKQILSYKLKNNLTREQIAEKMGISKAEAEDILFCCIEEFTLDRLITYISKLLNPAEVNIIIEQKKSTFNV